MILVGETGSGKVVERLKGLVDHHMLNEIPGLENPTTEVLAPWVGRLLLVALPGRKIEVEITESSTTGCMWMPEVW